MLTMWKTALWLVGLMVCLSHSVTAQTLTLGCWSMNSNGYSSTLCINTIDSSTGTFTGTQGLRRMEGVWNEAAKRIAFLAYPPSPVEPQYYTGYWFAESAASPYGLKRITGEFAAFKGSGGSGARFEFGWTATRY